ncbi:DUF6924 domain-containing protein [Streptomyces fuscichromogenes]|uniref:DUF6924 domain-containing protein n=1 Tax=Streptomyces fuscichromogenes TaxID=1324013 RepID=UPI0037F3E7E0
MPELTGTHKIGHMDAVVVRTDYTDEAAWHVVRSALVGPTDFDEPTPFVVDDPVWSGAGAQEVLAAVAADEYLSEYLSSVFIADRTTMRGRHHAFLAVTTVTRETYEDDEDFEATTKFGREFRTEPRGVHEIHANLELANMGFEDFSSSAHDDPEKVFRPSWGPR